MHVLVADDHAEVRWALRTFLREQLGMITVGEAGAAEELLAEADALRPDLILMQWELPGQTAAAVLAALRALELAAPVIVIGRRVECRQPALEAGAAAFVCKTESPDQLLQALYAVIPPIGRASQCARCPRARG